MNTYLFAWNPKKWPWDDLDKDIETLRKYGRLTERWSCSAHKSIQPGDRAFLVKVGVDPKGIIGSGYVTSEATLSPHFKEDKLVYRVNIDFDVLLNPEREAIVDLKSLKERIPGKQLWTPQSSGILIKKEVAAKLEVMWDNFLSDNRK